MLKKGLRRNPSFLIREAEFQNGVEEGRKEERKRNLIECVCKKIKKEKDIITIAEELEEETA